MQHEERLQAQVQRHNFNATAVTLLVPHIQTMSRFADIDLGNQFLQPIYGYWEYELVSLDRALAPVENCFSQLRRYAKIAIENCRFPSKHELTRDESAAVYLYTMEWGEKSFYRVLNEALRSENRNALKQWFPFLKLFDTALGKLPNVKENLWRGVPGDISKSFKRDQELTWWSVSSCSSSVDVIKDFIGSKSTLFMIEAVNGKSISGYTNFPKENEVLLGPGTRLRVKANALDNVGGLRVVHLIETSHFDKELPPPAKPAPHGRLKSLCFYHSNDSRNFDKPGSSIH